jgi:hypothetical protein
MPKDTRKLFAFGLDAGHDRNGNPRRGWMVYARDGDFVGFLDEGSRGIGVLRRTFPNAVELADRIPTTAAFIRELKTEDAI